jgi:hypothetical protein
MTQLQIEPAGLTRAEQLFFEENGYLGPYAACTPEEMASIRKQIEDEVFTTESPWQKVRGQSRHLDKVVVYDLCTRPAILERMAGILGPDLVLWRSNFFVKEPGGKEIPWHQDYNYWPIKPEINCTAWMAIDPVTVENSCPRLIPGSHRVALEHVKAGQEMSFQEMVNPRFIDESKAINMELKPGEFFLFNEKTLHQSNPNRSNKRRMGLAVRITVPRVKVDHSQLFEGHKVILVRGEDRYKLNQTTGPTERDL